MSGETWKHVNVLGQKKTLQTVNQLTANIIAHRLCDSNNSAIPVATLVVLVALFADGAFGILWNEIVEQIDWVFELLKQNSNNVADFNSCLLTVGFGGSSSSSTSSTVAFLEAVGGEAVVTSGFLLRFAAPGSR
jgi:hypothetical protein